MKHILVVDESGFPVYYDQRDGLMLCPIVSTIYNHMKGNFDETVKSWTCGKTKFFLKPYLPLLFLIVSDQGEPEAVLHSQVFLVYQIFLLLFGPEKLYNRKRSLDKFKATIQRLIDTTFQLLNENQSILVQSIESLELSDPIRNKCMEMLLKLAHTTPGVSHAMLFVGTKLVARHFISTKTSFTSMEMFLLILFFRTEFHPLIRELEFTKLHVADYTDHEEVIRAMQGDTVDVNEQEDQDQDVDENLGPDSEDGATSPDEGFDTAPEDWEESYTSGRKTLSAENPIVLFQSGWLDEIFNEGAHMPQETTSNSVNPSQPLNLTMGLRIEAAQVVLEALRTGLREGETKDNEALILLQYSLQVLGLTTDQIVDEGNFGPTTKEAVATFQLNNKLPSTGEADPATLVLLLRQTRVANAEAAKHSTKKALERAGKDFDESNNNNNNNNNNKNTTNTELTAPFSPGFTTPVKEKLMKPAFSTPTASSPIPPPRNDNNNNNNFSTPTTMPSTPVATTPTPFNFPSTPLSPPSFGTPSFGTPTRRAHTVPAKSVLEQLYLRMPQHVPLWVYCAEIYENTTLVIINQGLKGTHEEKERLDRSQQQFREWLRRNYAAYLLAKERAHIPILNSIHSYPGLVHYIFVNHQTNRVQAPTITPLSGQVHRDQSITDRMLLKLRREVWKLVHTSHEHLATGHTSMLVRKKDFTYSYRLWIVDDEGVEQVIERSALPLLRDIPIGYRFYKDLVQKLFPSQAQEIVCLELFTLYLGVLPTAMVSKNDRALIAMLHPQGDQ